MDGDGSCISWVPEDMMVACTLGQRYGGHMHIGGEPRLDPYMGKRSASSRNVCKKDLVQKTN